VGLSVLAAVALLVALLVLIGRSASSGARVHRRGNRLVLATDVGGAHEAGLVGAVGFALTDLRPSGAAEIDGQRIDVVAEAGYLAAGTTLEVVIDEVYRRVVRARRGQDTVTN
jgi:membrane-bound serine protease (ClpP class)